MGHSHSSLRKLRRSRRPGPAAIEIPTDECSQGSEDDDVNNKGVDKDKNDKNDNDNVNQQPPQSNTLFHHPVPPPIPRATDYLSPTSHDNEGVPFGRLRALCPSPVAACRPDDDNIDNIDNIPDADLEILAARARHNATLSPLCRLPDGLLVHIMCCLAWPDLYFLRHTSRVFMRLFATDDHFAGCRHADEFNSNCSTYRLPMPWCPPSPPCGCQALLLPVRCLLADKPHHREQELEREDWRQRCRYAPLQKQCRGCRAAPWPYQLQDLYMHCTACCVDHPTDLFSGPQTKIRTDKTTAARRVCIAHEGHVRLCAHKTVDWVTVVQSLPGGRVDNHFGDDVFDIPAKRWLRMSSEKSAEGAENTFSVEPYLRIVCDHPSHDMHSDHEQEGHEREGHEREGHERQEHEREGHERERIPDTPDDRLPPYARFAADSNNDNNDNNDNKNKHGQTGRPSFVVHDVMVDGVRYKVITWSYTAHMDLEGIPDGENDGAVTAQAFRDRLRALRRTDSAARCIAPLEYPGLLHEMRCVDPERCGCLLYPGFSRRENRPRQALVCREHEVVRAFNSRVSDLDHIRIRMVSCQAQTHTRCLQIVYVRTIRLEGFCINPDPLWSPALINGHRMPRGSVFRFLRDALDNGSGSVPLGWYQALNPLSYSMSDADDPERPHWLRCRHASCRLHPRFLRARVYGMNRMMNVLCEWGCEVAPASGYHCTGRGGKESIYFTAPKVYSTIVRTA